MALVHGAKNTLEASAKMSNVQKKDINTKKLIEML